LEDWIFKKEMIAHGADNFFHYLCPSTRLFRYFTM